MLFLLNDVVFDLDEACPVTPADNGEPSQTTSGEMLAGSMGW